MANFFIAVAVFLITVIGAVFSVPYFIDWNSYRGVFEEEASALLGREVRVGGTVNLHLLPTPYFRFEKVRIADTSVNPQAPIFRAESLTVKLTIPPLLRGAVEANEIEFQRPVLRLAVDKDGGWNWQSFGKTFASVTYMPTNVALTSVKIADGVFAVHGTDGGERLRIEGLEGELSAPSLDGPYRFRGTYGKGAAQREIRIGTARADGDGSVRFRAMLRMGGAGSSYALDGRVLDLMGRPRIEGELTARLPTVGIWQAAVRAAPPVQKEATAAVDELGGGAGPAFDLKAAVRMDAAGAALSNLNLSFEQDGRPQLITGDIKARWNEALAVDMILSSRWLDLDRIAGAAEGASPLDSIVPLAVRMQDLLPAEGRSRASLSIAQTNIGGEAINGLQLVLARTGDRLEVQELRLGMPGGSRGELQGTVSGPPDATVFGGTVGLHGTSLARFLAWATGNAVPAEAKGDGPFGIRAQLSISPERMTVRDIVGDLSGTAVYGAVQYGWIGQPQLALALESPRLDARPVLPAGGGLDDALRLLMHGAAATPREGQTQKSTGKAAGRQRAQTDVSMRLTAGQLITAVRTYRDVTAQVDIQGGTLRLPLLRLASDQGFSLELEGKVETAASRPKGTLRGNLTVTAGRAVDPLADLIGIPAAYRLDDRRAEAVAPLRLAGSVSFGLRTATSTDVTLDGEANGANVKLTGHFDGSSDGWRKGPADVVAVIEGADAGIIAALMAPGGASQRAEGVKPGRLLIRAKGVPAEGLTSLATVETGELNLGFSGQVVAGEGGAKVSGEARISATDSSRIAALAGLAPPLSFEGLPISGTLNFTAAEDRIGIDRLSLNIAGSAVKGQLALSAAGDRRGVEGRLDVSEISLAKLLAPLLDQRLAVTGAAEAALSGRQSLWPGQPFDTAVLDGFEGNIKVNTARLALADGISIRNARLDVALDAGKLDVKSLEGTAFGGRCRATVRIEKVPGGAEVAGSVRLEAGKLEALAAATRGATPGTSGSASGEIAFSGKGTSPRSAIAALTGAGTLRLEQAALTGIWPGAVNAALDAALKVGPEHLAATLKQALVAGLSARPAQLPRTLGLELGDGQLRIKPFAVETPEGRAAGNASLDLRSLTLESDWRLEQNPAAGPTPDKPALPAVAVSYRGAVSSLGALEPQIVTEPLEREISVRKMERDVEELERLRKLDEARRREEAERLRRQFEPLPPTVPVPPPGQQARPAAPG
jgi:uncharacterized protein involved in outer membrane biogenesis